MTVEGFTKQHMTCIGLFLSLGDGIVREIIIHKQLKSPFFMGAKKSEMSRGCLGTGPHFSQNARFVCTFWVE